VGPGVYVTITEALGANDANDSITGMRPVDSMGRAIPISGVSHSGLSRQTG
jgi:hypothetical protein